MCTLKKRLVFEGQINIFLILKIIQHDCSEVVYRQVNWVDGLADLFVC